MKLTELEIDGVWLVESTKFGDERGIFREWFKYSDIKKQSGIEFNVRQANMSISKKAVIRGIHYSLAPIGQAKLITCAQGSLLDVVVDIRTNSPTFLKKIYIKLNSTSPQSLLIKSGLGHGFIALEDNTVLTYLLNSSYQPKYEHKIMPTDQILSINWSLEMMNYSRFIISPEDKFAPTLNTKLIQGLLPKISL